MYDICYKFIQFSFILLYLHVQKVYYTVSRNKHGNSMTFFPFSISTHIEWILMFTETDCIYVFYIYYKKD